MEEKILKEIIDNLKDSLKEKGRFIKLSYDSYEPIEISKDNFHEIPDLMNENKIAFIDGGNAEILKAANFSLQFLRVYYTIYQNNKRIENNKYEFYLLIKAFDKNDKISYKTKIFGDKIIEDFEFDSFDQTITQGKNRADVSFLGNVLRRFSELAAAKEIIQKLDNDDIIVLDGSLETKYTNEGSFLDDIYQKCHEKNIILSGLSKTCELFTDKGNSFIGVLAEIQPENSWYYHPAARINEKFDMFFLKLNDKSKYMFRYDVDYRLIDKINDVLSILKDNSKDPIFMGYPYGLIEADKFARVSNKELEFFKTKLMARSGKDWKNISSFLRAKDSHAILDTIS